MDVFMDDGIETNLSLALRTTTDLAFYVYLILQQLTPV